MANITWTHLISGQGANWKSGSNWSSSSEPGPDDTAIFSLAGAAPYTASFDEKASGYATAGLTISNANVTLAFDVNDTALTVTDATTLSAGTIDISATSTLTTDTFTESGGTFNECAGAFNVIGANAAFAVNADSFNLAGGAVTVASNASLNGGTAAISGGTFTAGSLTVAGGTLDLSGGALNVSGATTLSAGSITVDSTPASYTTDSLSVIGGSLVLSRSGEGVTGSTNAITVTHLASLTGGTVTISTGELVAGALIVGDGTTAQTLTIGPIGMTTVSGLTTIGRADTTGGSRIDLLGSTLAANGGITFSDGSNPGTLAGLGFVTGGPISGNGTIVASGGELSISNRINRGPTLALAADGSFLIAGTAASAAGISLDSASQQIVIPFTEQAAIGGYGTINADVTASGDGIANFVDSLGGELTLNGNLSGPLQLDINSASTEQLLGTTGPGILVTYLDSTGGTLRLGSPTARSSFEANGTISGMNVPVGGTGPTNVIDLAGVLPTTFTSAIIDGNTIELFNGSTVTDHFTLASAPGPGTIVNWTPDGSGGTNVFLSATTAPTVSSVVTSGSGITAGTGDLDVGATVTFTLNLSEAVTVAGGVPTLTLNDGGTATYVSGSGSGALAFGYRVGAGQTAADLAISVVNLNTATVRDAAGNNADTTGALVNPAGTLQIDTTAPTAPGSLVLAPGSDTGAHGDGITSVARPVINGDAGETGDIVTLFDDGTAIGTGTVGAGGIWSVTAATALTESANAITATQTDLAGNVSTPSIVLDVTLDTAAPGVLAVTAAPADAVLGVGALVTLTLRLHEPVTVDTSGGQPTLTLNNGATVVYVSGTDTSALTFNYTVAAGQDVADLAVAAVNMNGATVTDNAGNSTDLPGAAVNPPGTLELESIAAFDTTINQSVGVIGKTYSGPVADLQDEYINITSDNLNVSAATPNWFIHAGSGDNAIAVSSGTNVLDGGTGSNFLTGGSGTDTFFVDNRGASADTWSTIVNFQTGDATTIWGVTSSDFSFDVEDNQGAAGFTGLTLHATAAGKPIVSVTFAGFTMADLSNGRISESFGTEPVSGSTYTYFHANA